MAIATPLLAGTANVTIDGAAYMLEGDLIWSTNRVKRSSKNGMDGFHGFKEEPVAPYMEFTLSDNGAISVAAIGDMTGVTVVAQLANGKTVIGRNMGSVDQQEVNSTEGTFKARFEGPFVEED